MCSYYILTLFLSFIQISYLLHTTTNTQCLTKYNINKNPTHKIPLHNNPLPLNKIKNHIKTKDINTTPINVNLNIKINRINTLINMASIMIKEKSATIPKYHKCPKNLKQSQINLNLIKKLINYKIKSSNSKNSENKKKITTKMVPKPSLIKSKIKKKTLILPKHVLLFSIMTKRILKQISMMLKTKLINIKRKLISSTDLLKNQLKPVKFKKWISKNLLNKKIESHMKCQLKIFPKPKKLNFRTNWTKSKKEKLKFQKKMFQQFISMMKNLMKSKAIKMQLKS